MTVLIFERACQLGWLGILVDMAPHIMPPIGAKGLSPAASDVAYLAEALIGCFRNGNPEPLRAAHEVL